MRTSSAVLLTIVLALVGCAHKKAAAPPAAPVAARPAAPQPQLPPPPPPVKSIALRVDPAGMPKVGEKLNSLLAGAHVPGATAHSQATVTIEDAQLSVECVESTAACYAAVGKSLGANRLVFAEITKGGKKKKPAGIKVTVTLFDVDAGAVTRSSDRSFKKEAEAVSAVKDLVDAALGPGATAGTTQPPPEHAPTAAGRAEKPTTTAAVPTANPSSKAK